MQMDKEWTPAIFKNRGYRNRRGRNRGRAFERLSVIGAKLLVKTLADLEDGALPRKTG
ncbi:MAG: hypothetical protein ACLR56_06555 [Oscillospiraceae bacterium]